MLNCTHFQKQFKLLSQPDNTEILGYTLGLLSFAIACTSRFPAICRAVSGAQHKSVLMSKQHHSAFSYREVKVFNQLLFLLFSPLVQRSQVDSGPHDLRTALPTSWHPLRRCHPPLWHSVWVSSKSHAMADVGCLLCRPGHSCILTWSWVSAAACTQPCHWLWRSLFTSMESFSRAKLQFLEVCF